MIDEIGRNGKRLLLVADGDPQSRYNLCQMLGEIGFETIEATDDRTCFDLCDKRHPDLVIIGDHLPALGGFAVCSEVQSRFNIPVLMSLAKPDSAAIDFVFECGAEDFVSFPLHRPMLERRVCRVLDAQDCHMAQEHYKALFDLAPVAIFTKDRAGRYTSVNATAISYMAGSRLGLTDDDLFPGEVATQLRAQDSLVMETNQEHTFEVVLPTMNGLRMTLARKVALRDVNGQAIGVMGVSVDITERKDAEKALSEQNELLQALFQHSPDAIMLLDPATNVILDCNDMACRMNGYSRAELVGQNINLLDPGTMQIDIGAESYEDYLRRIGLVQYEALHRRKDGVIFPIEVSTCIINVGGRELILGIDRDITERKRMEMIAIEQRTLAEALRDTSAALTSTLKLDEVLDRILVHVAYVVPHDTSCITLIEGEYARVVRCRGFAERGEDEAIILQQRFRLADVDHFREMMVTHEPVIITDVSQQPTWVDVAETSLWIHSHLSAPILVQGDLIGFIHLDSRIVGAFSATHAHHLRAFAGQAAIALQNARLYGEVDKLYRSTAFLLTSFTSGDVLDLGRQIVQAAVKEFDQVNCSIFLSNSETRQLVRVAHTGDYLVENPPPSNLDEPVGLVAAVCRTGEVIYAPDVRESPYYLQGNARTCSELVIPLRTAEHILGALDLQSEEYNAFTPHDQRILRAFADRVALAIDNMRYATDLEQRVAERTMEVLQAKNQAEAILNNSGDAIIVVTADNQIQQTNPTFDDLFGYEPCVLLEQSLFMLTTQGDAERLRDTIQTVIAANQSTRLEIVARRKNGTTFDADVAIAPIKEYADQQRRVVCSLRDITDRKQVEIELRKALERERELSELKSRFVSTTSHEFRTPLATMMTASELIRNYGHRMTEDQRMERLVSIQTQIKAMTQLLDDVLVVSREQEFRPEPLDIIGFCQRILDAVRLNDSTAHAFEFVWEGCEKTLIGDKALLARILNGLLNNAVKYSPPGSPVLLKLICEDKQTQIVVQDEGIGIPNEDQKRLFEVFHRAANVGVISGTGLGLSIVKQSAELHGGRVDFKSKIGLGSTFTVTIPNVLVEVTQ